MTSIVRGPLSEPLLRSDKLATDVRTHVALGFYFMCGRAISSMYLSIARLSAPVAFSSRKVRAVAGPCTLHEPVFPFLVSISGGLTGAEPIPLPITTLVGAFTLREDCDRSRLRPSQLAGETIPVGNTYD
jgi:hypothetical protein